MTHTLPSPNLPDNAENSAQKAPVSVLPAEPANKQVMQVARNNKDATLEPVAEKNAPSKKSPQRTAKAATMPHAGIVDVVYEEWNIAHAQATHMTAQRFDRGVDAACRLVQCASLAQVAECQINFMHQALESTLEDTHITIDMGLDMQQRLCAPLFAQAETLFKKAG